jgi:hypothetical protein
MQTGYSCPFCHSAIGVDDVNVATDIAMCRSCGKTSAFSLISGMAEVSPDLVNNPPRWTRLEMGPMGGTMVVYRRVSPILLFLVPFTALWSGGSMYGIYIRQFIDGKFDLARSLFGIPFLIGTVVLLSAIMYLLTGRWIITLDRGQGSVFVGAWGIGWTRRFSYDRGTLVSIRMTSMTVNDRPQKGVFVRTGETDFVFGAMLPEETKRFIAAVIMREAAGA